MNFTSITTDTKSSKKKQKKYKVGIYTSITVPQLISLSKQQTNLKMKNKLKQKYGKTYMKNKWNQKQ